MEFATWDKAGLHVTWSVHVSLGLARFAYSLTCIRSDISLSDDWNICAALQLISSGRGCGLQETWRVDERLALRLRVQVRISGQLKSGLVDTG